MKRRKILIVALQAAIVIAVLSGHGLGACPTLV